MYQHITVYGCGKFYVTLVAVLMFLGGAAFVEAATIAEDADLLDGLVSYWPLDEIDGIRNDVAGPNHLSPYGDVESDLGLKGSGISLRHKESSYLAISDADHVGLDMANGFSVAAWVYVETTPPNNPIENGSYTIASKASEGGDEMGWIFRYGLNLRHDAFGEEQLNLVLGNYATGKFLAQYSVPVSIGTKSWRHVVLTLDTNDSEIKFYVDGLQAGEAMPAPAAIYNSEAPFLIGGYDQGYPSTIFDGLIDEVGIWNRALTADEVAKLYNDGEGIPYAAIEEEPETVEYADLSTGELFQMLHAHVHESDMPWWLRKWIDQRLALAEKQIEKGRRGNLRAADVILRSVLWTIERQERRGIISETDADVVRTLIEEIQTRL